MTDIRIVVASKSPIVRSALAALLKEICGFEVAAEIDLSELAEAVKKLTSEVLLVELTECGPDGSQAVASLARSAPAAPVVILSENQNPAYIRTMLAWGVKAYVLKSASDSELYDVIRAAHRHKRYLDPRLGARAELMPNRNTIVARKRRRNSLSTRESEVLREVARGFTTRTIALRLGLSQRTVQTYRERISEKLHLRTRADLVRYAIEQGMMYSVESLS